MERQEESPATRKRGPSEEGQRVTNQEHKKQKQAQAHEKEEPRIQSNTTIEPTVTAKNEEATEKDHGKGKKRRKRSHKQKKKRQQENYKKYSELTWEEKRKLEEEKDLKKEESYLNKQRVVPRDRNGRIPKFVNLSDYRPSAPRNTSQFLIQEHSLQPVKIDSLHEGCDSGDDTQAMDNMLSSMDNFGSMAPFGELVKRNLIEDKSAFQEPNEIQHEARQGVGNNQSPSPSPSPSPSTCPSFSSSSAENVFMKQSRQYKEQETKLNFLEEENHNLRVLVSQLRKEITKLKQRLRTSDRDGDGDSDGDGDGDGDGDQRVVQ